MPGPSKHDLDGDTRIPGVDARKLSEVGHDVCTGADGTRFAFVTYHRLPAN